MHMIKSIHWSIHQSDEEEGSPSLLFSSLASSTLLEVWTTATIPARMAAMYTNDVSPRLMVMY